MSPYKVQLAVDYFSLNKGCNIALPHLSASLQARREATIRGVAAVAKSTAFPARRALPLTASHLADTHTLAVTPR